MRCPLVPLVIGLVMAAGTSVAITVHAVQVQTPDVAATRTAIAVTREPSLLTPRTPTGIELTATQIEANIDHDRSIAETQIAQGTPPFMVATNIVFNATQTSVAMTQNPSCLPYVNHLDQFDEMRKLNAQLQNIGLNSIFARITLVTVANYCDHKPILLETQFVISIILDKLSKSVIADHLRDIISQLPPNLDSHKYGERIRLYLYFRDNDYNLSFIDTGYRNAIRAYEEGLCGAALVEALGGLLDFVP